jgi:transcription termination factor Rho
VGSTITATATPDPRFPNPKIRFIEKVDGLEIDERRRRTDFANLTTITPNEQIKLELKDGRMTTRVMDLFAPIGKGTRGLIVAPPRTGKTTYLRDIALGVLQNHPECHVMILLVDERPEEVTDFKRSVPCEVWASSNDDPVENHIRIADLCIERAKRLVEAGRDVVLLIDSLTRLARAHNPAKNSGRTGTGGLDVRALEKPRQLFAAARNTEDGGSLTIIASILVETGSRMDDVIFQEFKGTGNMELVLDRKAAEMRIWPAVNVQSSGTRKEELLISDPKTLEGIHFFRRALVQQKIEEATDTLVTRLGKTKTNAEFIKLIVK